MSYAQLDTDVAAWIVTQGPTRMLSDIRTDVEITPGTTVFQLRVDPIENVPRSSNDDQRFADVTVLIYHRLADKLDERAYTTATRLTLADTLTTPSAWRTVATVHQVENIEGGAFERIGHVIAFEINARVGLQPA